MAAPFVVFLMENGVLRFGTFTLKSGRESPYFFNLGLIASGMAMRRLGTAYASALAGSDIKFDMLFGPAYKGIPLVTATMLAFAEMGRDLPYAFNRKEVKDHGEGGLLIGADPRGHRVVIVDDVLTAGTALRESIELLRSAGAEPVGALVAFDRQERGKDKLSAVQELGQEFGMPVISVAKLSDLMDYLVVSREHPEALVAIKQYSARYGVTS